MKSFSLKSKLNTFFAVFYILNKSFFKTAKGIVYTIVLPLVFMVMFKFIFQTIVFVPGDDVINEKIKQINLLSYTLLPLATMFILCSSSIVEWKNSVFLKRIDSSGISKLSFIFSLWLFYSFISLIGFLLLFAFSFALGQEKYVSALKDMNWNFIILGILLISLMSISLSIFLGGINSNIGVLQGIVLGIFFISIFMSGMLLSPAMFEKSDITRYITYIIPFKHAVFVFLYGAYGGGSMTAPEAIYNHSGYSRGYDYTEIWQPIIISLGLILIFLLVSLKTFKWSAGR